MKFLHSDVQENNVRCFEKILMAVEMRRCILCEGRNCVKAGIVSDMFRHFNYFCEFRSFEAQF